MLEVSVVILILGIVMLLGSNVWILVFAIHHPNNEKGLNTVLGKVKNVQAISLGTMISLFLASLIFSILH